MPPKNGWAGKMAGKERPAVSVTGSASAGQRQVHNFPVLDLWAEAECHPRQMELKFMGTWKSSNLFNGTVPCTAPIPGRERFHCVTTWSQFELRWEGVAFLPGRFGKAKPSAPRLSSKATTVTRPTIRLKSVWTTMS